MKWLYIKKCLKSKALIFDICEKGKEAILKCLVEIGKADINIENCSRETPLFYACRNENEIYIFKININILM